MQGWCLGAAMSMAFSFHCFNFMGMLVSFPSWKDCIVYCVIFSIHRGTPILCCLWISQGTESQAFFSSTDCDFVKLYGLPYGCQISWNFILWLGRHWQTFNYWQIFINLICSRDWSIYENEIANYTQVVDSFNVYPAKICTCVYRVFHRGIG